MIGSGLQLRKENGKTVYVAYFFGQRRFLKD